MCCTGQQWDPMRASAIGSRNVRQDLLDLRSALPEALFSDWSPSRTATVGSQLLSLTPHPQWELLGSKQTGPDLWPVSESCCCSHTKSVFLGFPWPDPVGVIFSSKHCAWVYEPSLSPSLLPSDFIVSSLGPLYHLPMTLSSVPALNWVFI